MQTARIGKSGKQPILDEISRRWEAWCRRPFPEGPHETADSELVSIDTYLAGCISVFVSNHGKLDRKRIYVLRSCAAELDPVIDRLTGDTKEYFTELSQLSHLVLQFIE